MKGISYVIDSSGLRIEGNLDNYDDRLEGEKLLESRQRIYKAIDGGWFLYYETSY